MAMDIIGFSGEVPRMPLKGLTKPQRDNLSRELVERGFIN